MAHTALGASTVNWHLACAHIEALRSLPLHHRDPFDRLLVAQALVEHATLVTHDRALAPYGVPTLWC